MDWYYCSGGQRSGPVSPQELEQKLKEGVIKPDDLVWNQSMGEEWAKASAVPGLAIPEAPAAQSVPRKLGMAKREETPASDQSSDEPSLLASKFSQVEQVQQPETGFFGFPRKGNFKALLVCAVAGIALIVWGREEKGLTEGTSEDPVDVQLLSLEQGHESPNKHLRIGPHWRLYPATVYAYTTHLPFDTEPGEGTNIDEAFYPIVSPSHSIMKDNATDPSQFGGVAVVVKTTKLKEVKDIPGNSLFSQSIEGLIINEIESLSSEEKKLLKEALPNIDCDNLLILQEGRKPKDNKITSLIIYGGIALAAIGVLLLPVRLPASWSE